MNLVQTQGHYGKLIVVDQCPTCFGIWFDENEFIQVKQEEANKLDSINIQGFKTDHFINADPICPKDSLKLIAFRDPNFPKSINIGRCTKCNGIWFNKGEFSRYHSERKRLVEEKLDTKFEEQMDKIIQTYHEGNYETIGKLGEFLMTPYYNLDKNPNNEKNANTAQNIATAILSLVRFLVLKSLH